jgi:hypothetical protein
MRREANRVPLFPAEEPRAVIEFFGVSSRGAFSDADSGIGPDENVVAGDVAVEGFESHVEDEMVGITISETRFRPC